MANPLNVDDPVSLAIVVHRRDCISSVTPLPVLDISERPHEWNSLWGAVGAWGRIVGDKHIAFQIIPLFCISRSLAAAAMAASARRPRQTQSQSSQALPRCIRRPRMMVGALASIVFPCPGMRALTMSVLPLRTFQLIYLQYQHLP